MKEILCIVTILFLVGCTGDLSGEAPSALKFCGDGKCHPSEAETCPEDCGGPMCGDGVVDISEECDPAGSTESCTVEDYDLGIMTCLSDCTYDKSDCRYSGPYCGDGTCNQGEDCMNCAVDCDSKRDSYCGDNICNDNEDCESCPMDCNYGELSDCSACQKGACDGRCNPQDGPGCPDCGINKYCCGSDTCASELCGSGCGTNGNIIECCGNSECEGAETYLSCGIDCLLGDAECTDTDGGYNLGVKGTATGYAMSYLYKDQANYNSTDNCLPNAGNASIYEKYCANVDDLIASYSSYGLDTDIFYYYKNRGVTELVAWKQDTCDYLCVDGACVNEPVNSCGDGVCSTGEDCSSCPADCGCSDGNCVNGCCFLRSCSDSDGENQYAKGTTSSYTNTICSDGETPNVNSVYDYCSGSALNEYICDGDMRYQRQFYCENGCSNGACILSENQCFDSDGGNEKYIKGSAAGPHPYTRVLTIYEDYCENNYLKEAVCDIPNHDGGYGVMYYTVPCEDGCEDGVCLSVSCQEGETQQCHTVNGCQGTQACNSGIWGACISTQNFCDTDCDGTSECTSQQCPTCTCISGETQSCLIGSATGTKTCYNGTWGQCEATCTDSDGGKNSAVPGVVTYGGSTYEDSCYSFSVNETYCLNNTPATILLGCGTGYCENGACRPYVDGR